MDPQHTTIGGDEAQRTLERKALRNVRGLVDKLETEQREGSRATMRFVVGSVIAALAVGVLAFVLIAGNKKTQAPITSAPRRRVRFPRPADLPVAGTRC